ncbi:MAG TPA: DNA mismatch repair endonuclease MutL [Verrucomicrobiales bacterium]|nr:DNA mismatch repair endonuclease MutL [Verrucomicrobiales bacterium]
MGKVKVMTDSLASQVAAGEVVERPSSVVKELIENSLDADAKSIDVIIERGGKSLIKVLDNGEGMSRDDSILSIERHATSKLIKSSDLNNILTFGFRGEALPSIASVSRFRLSTRQHGALVGTEILIEGGKIKDVRDSGDAPGTQVEIRSLFSNVPARKKFLRADSTEISRIETVVRIAAISRYDVGFSLRHGKREIFKLGPATKPIDRILDLIGSRYADGLIQLNHDKVSEGDLNITGWVSAPGVTVNNRKIQFVFVNDRPVDSLLIKNACREAYRGMTERGSHPLIFLFIGVNPNEVDVNIHPSKKEIKFRNEKFVQSEITSLIVETLRDFTSKSLSEGGVANVPSLSAESEQLIELVQLSDESDDELEVLDEPSVDLSSFDLGALQKKLSKSLDNTIDSSSEESFEILGVLLNKYIIIQKTGGLILLHKRAAHERILYEKALNQIEEQEFLHSQPLLVPVILSLLPEDYHVALDSIPLLKRIGLEIEDFGNNNIKVDALPAVFSGDDTEGFVTSIIGELRDSGSNAVAQMTLTELTKSLSYKVSQYHESTTNEEMNALVSDLLKCDMPYVDTRGRSTMTEFSISEIDRRFEGR